jgi:hypothetical protein
MTLASVGRIDMARMKKRRLSWQASRSSQVVGYKFYWAFGTSVDYDADCVELGSITELVLPDDVEAFVPASGPVEFGITAVDELGNESDMVILKAPYQFSVPEAPANLKLEAVEESPAPADSRSGDKESKPMSVFKDDDGVRLLKSL